MTSKFATTAEALSALQTDVANQSTVIDGAVTLISGIPALITGAVQKAIASGADPSQLQAFSDLNDTLTAKTAALANAVASAPSGAVQPGEGVTDPAPITSPLPPAATDPSPAG